MDSIEKIGIKYLFECFKVNFDNGNLIWKKRPLSHFKNERDMNWWNSRFAGKKAGGIQKIKNRYTNYYVVRINKKIYKIHRIIYFMKHRILIDKDRKIIDHIDRNGLNNSIDNLRLVNNSENVLNCRIRKKHKFSSKNTSGIKGVSFSKIANRWRIYIHYNNKQYHFGYFRNIEEAGKALKKAREQFKIRIKNEK